MRILFVTMAPIEQGPAGPTSQFASTRYRVLMPALQLDRLGHQVQIATLPQGPVPPGFLQVPCDVLVFSKSFRAEHEPLVDAQRARGARIVADYCDDHFENREIGEWYTKLAKTADVVVALPMETKIRGTSAQGFLQERGLPERNVKAGINVVLQGDLVRVVGRRTEIRVGSAGYRGEERRMMLDAGDGLPVVIQEAKEAVS